MKKTYLYSGCKKPLTSLHKNKNDTIVSTNVLKNMSLLIALLSLSMFMALVTIMAVPGTPHTIYGFVFDHSGKPLKDAVVSLTNLNTSEQLNTTTASDGSYVFELANLQNGYSDGDLIEIEATYEGCYANTHIYVDLSCTMQKAPDIILLLLTDFDTGPGSYPGISGVHTGNIIPAHNIKVEKMFTYPCPGTGGHTEYVEIRNETFVINASWKGYGEDWHNITFSQPFVLTAGRTYNYTIRTGSYPMIIHKQMANVSGGKITCTKFVSANGKRYDNWIPAIRLFH